MNLRTAIGLSRESLLEEGTPDEVAEKKRRAHDEQLRPVRLALARRNAKWHELEEVDLVPRGRGWLVSAETDAIYQPVRGVVFEPYSVQVVADMTELWFYVDRDGELHFLERVAGTWTQHVEKQAQRERRHNAPRPRPAWMDR